MNPLLIIDTNYLCYRAYHVFSRLSFQDVGTGAVYGVLQDIIQLQEFFQTNRCVFAFDHGPGLRRSLCPTYKGTRAARRAEMGADERRAREDLEQQIHLLRTQYLPTAGFRNVFAAHGYEADDIIASVAARVPTNDEAIIIGSDHDLWQCIRENVWCWNPQKKVGYDIGQFRKEWGIEPGQWPTVKAAAGCATDDIPGVRGIGEATAARWLRGELPGHTATARKLTAAADIIEKNLLLVRLPFPGTPNFDIVRDEITEETWSALADRLGMRSIRNKIPRAATRKSKGRKRGERASFGF